MKEQALPVIAILLSLAAIGLSLSRNGSGGESDATRPPSVDQLEKRLKRLESRIAQIPGDEHSKLTGLVHTDAPPAEEASVTDLRSRQEELEAYLNQLGVFEHFEAQQVKIAESYELTLDPKRATKERLTSLRLLRDAGKIDQAVVDSMMEVWEEAMGDEKGGGWTRWYLLENLEGVTDTQFRDNILEWLPGEESPKFRARAIETLEPMMPDPDVAEWLVHLGENDPEPKIRQLAVDAHVRALENK